MKVWVKLLIGSILGIVLGSFLPSVHPAVLTWLPWLQELAVRIGRYTVAPILFFSLTIGVYELRRDGGFWPLALRTFLVMAGSTFVVILGGIWAVLLFSPPRIPILVEEQLQAVSLGNLESIQALFPSNMFFALVSDGVYLFPMYVCAFFLGIGLSYDRSYTKPVITLVDSLSRVFYHIGSFFSEILGIIMIVLSAYWAVSYQEALSGEGFRSLMLLLGVLSLVLIGLVLPLMLCLLKADMKPLRVIYGLLGPALAGFFSGDLNFSLPVLLRHSKENLGVRRRVNAVALSLFSTFGRSGSAMVAAVAFVVIIKSYSSLEIYPKDLLFIGFRIFIISFCLARHPGDGAYTALAVLCLHYGQGYEGGYLLLKPLAFYLIAVGTLLDTMITGVGVYALAEMSGLREKGRVGHSI
ncbi:MAG: cation:dicarboxylase symporter family transporter [Spirochaetaceae bacterium]|jgi:Na+/H+-dicarboxylate symporter|nr:cation:dicarboxylase symporter family transporter [Spirochaetaceae bacterium]